MNKKGFTIIELIVVIAIIAVLATIVLVNVTQYINKGKDAAAQGNLASLLTNSATFIDGGGTYAGFVVSAQATAAIAAINSTNEEGSGAAVITDAGHAIAGWCASTTLKGTGGPYCVDSSGTKKMGSTCTAIIAVCP